MHISEGLLSYEWCLFWGLISLPFVLYGIYTLEKIVRERRDALPLVAVSGAFVFVLSSLKIPSFVTQSCSHLTGTGLSSLLFGPALTSLISVIVLLFQALLLAHGSITGLGANVFSMGIAGPLSAYAIYKIGESLKINFFSTVFVAASVADLTTYATTSLQFALAFPAANGEILTAFETYLGIFAITQLPLAIIEGIVTTLTLKYIILSRPDLKLRIISAEQIASIQERFR